MDRRDILRTFGLVSAHALFPSILSGFVASCQSGSNGVAYVPTFFSEKEFDVLKETIDIILPATTSASASATNTHHFIDEVFTRCLDGNLQAFIRKGFSAFVPEFEASSDKKQLITEIDEKAYHFDVKYTWFVSIKQYALIGFFTSQEGSTKASNYVAVPGDYKGEIPLTPNTLNYGLTSLHYYI